VDHDHVEYYVNYKKLYEKKEKKRNEEEEEEEKKVGLLLYVNEYPTLYIILYLYST
jgi:hypothetical protein